MADRINFEKKINDSVQAGDELYWLPVGTPDPILVGIITGVGDKYVEVGTATAPAFVADTMFFMFRKPSSDNIASVNGYFAEVSMSNSQSIKQELFSVGSEISISSK